jgi:hypothetical protein
MDGGQYLLFRHKTFPAPRAVHGVHTGKMWVNCHERYGYKGRLRLWIRLLIDAQEDGPQRKPLDAVLS